VRGEGDEPVLVGALPPVFPLHIVIIEAMFFFNEAIRLEDCNVADDGTAMDTALVGDGLVTGEALIGFAISEGEQGGVGCPDRAGESGHVLVGDFFEANPVIFCFAGFGFGGFAVAMGSAHGIYPFQSPCRVLRFQGKPFLVFTLEGCFVSPEAFVASQPY
jgi:hypothetical protein